MSDLDKELQEFDIDLDKDDVSDDDYGRTRGAHRKSVDEDEVNMSKARSQRPTGHIYLARRLTNSQHDLLSSSDSRCRTLFTFCLSLSRLGSSIR